MSPPPDAAPDADREVPPAAAPAPRVRGWRLWTFRLAAMVAAPAAILGLLELGLWVAGYGRPTAFLLPALHNDRTTFEQNNQFGARFFGPQLARSPCPFSFPQTRGPDTVRILVFGESAARGDPHPRVGLPAMLQATLSLRHPGARFEVVNVAMTAVNSHVILPIARDCGAAGADIWVVYMGNNEVVGPYGAGTVFGSRTLPLPFIRASIALKATRTGQWLDSLRQDLRQPPSGMNEWGGMKMFLEQQVAADDPRMNGVYDHFRRNLDDILRVGRRSGAGIVLSTVAVNLKDCPPFASAHRAGLPAAEAARWDQCYQLGIKAQDAGDCAAAAARFQEAEQIDDCFAELRFRQGECALALGRVPEAQRHFRAARELDTLRFRCDDRLNELTRQAASNHADGRVLLADAEREFEQASPGGLPGRELFYEHVHLTFEGSYLLAQTIATQVEKLLPEPIVARGGATPAWPSAADCARRLAWSGWEQTVVLNKVFALMSDPPFTGQLRHEQQLQSLRTGLASLAPATQPAAIFETLRTCETALVAAPEDPALNMHLAILKQMTGDVAGATTAARRGLELLPSDAAAWSQLGSLLAQQQQYAEASAAFQRAFELEPRDVMSLGQSARALAALGRHVEAVNEFRRVLALEPHPALAWLGLGQSLERTGRKAESEDAFRRALASPARNPSELTDLAMFCQGRGWKEEAGAKYAEAVKLDPANARLNAAAAQSLVALGRLAEAAKYSAEAARLAPGVAEAHLLHGTILLQQGAAGTAEEQLREAVRLNPVLLQARLNLGLSLLQQQRPADAIPQLEEALRLSPSNAVALKYLHLLRQGPGGAPAP